MPGLHPSGSGSLEYPPQDKQEGTGHGPEQTLPAPQGPQPEAQQSHQFRVSGAQSMGFPAAQQLHASAQYQGPMIPRLREDPARNR